MIKRTMELLLAILLLIVGTIAFTMGAYGIYSVASGKSKADDMLKAKRDELNTLISERTDVTLAALKAGRLGNTAEYERLWAEYDKTEPKFDSLYLKVYGKSFSYETND